MSSSLPPWVELSILQLPGRETLFNAPMYDTMKPLVDATLPIIGPLLEVPYLFFGHSLGAHVAFELSRELRRENAPLPHALIVSGTRAPHLPLRRVPLFDLPTPKLIDELRRYGGTPEAVLQNRELMDIFLPPLRADLTIFETYVHTPDAPFDFMIAAFGGRNDHRLDPGDLDAWQKHTTGRFSVSIFDGGHFYLLEQSRAAFSRVFRETLETFG